MGDEDRVVGVVERGVARLFRQLGGVGVGPEAGAHRRPGGAVGGGEGVDFNFGQDQPLRHAASLRGPPPLPRQGRIRR
jgi:hypothetical protein